MVSDRLETLGAGEGLPPGLQRGRHARVSGRCNPLGQLRLTPVYFYSEQHA